jgi:PAT family beta-lactamase induction signal transducer AmpG
LEQSTQTRLATLKAKGYFKPEIIAMLFLGFSAGLPILLIFSSLSVWLTQAGVEKSSVTYFSWAALAYSFKFLWAPLVDKLPLYFLTSWLGKRRGWLLLSQLAIVSSICMMALIDPSSSDSALTLMAFAAVALGFSSATQDIVIDAYRIEAVSSELQALMSSMYISGYRLGMIVAGAGTLLLAGWFNSAELEYSYDAWRLAYLCMVAAMAIGIITNLLIKEPQQTISKYTYGSRDYAGLVVLFLIGVMVFVVGYINAGVLLEPLKMGSPVIDFLVTALRLFVALIIALVIGYAVSQTGLVNRQMARETYILPVLEFFRRHQRSAILILAIIGLYRMSDIVLGVIANVFYVDSGFTVVEIATVVKTFGVIMTIAGGFVGGVMAIKYGVISTLYIGGILAVATNLLFMLLANAAGFDAWLADVLPYSLYTPVHEHLNISLLYFVISADNLSAGIATTAFVAFLSSLTNLSFTAVQYAIFSSLMTFIPKTIGGYSGSIVESVGYSHFFLIASLMGLPVLVLIYFVRPLIANKQTH